MKTETIEDIITPADEAERQKNERMVREGFWPKFRAFSRHIPFADEVVAAYYCAMDRKTPLKVRATLFGALAYFILPFDLVPDMLLLIGLGDDLAVLTFAIATVRGAITEEHRRKAREALADEVDGAAGA